MLSASRTCVSVVALSMCSTLARASSFLSRVAAEGPVETMTPELQSTILQEISETLSNSAAMGDRLVHIKDSLRTTFNAMPKNEAGKLPHAGVRYTLHSYFVQRHAWYVRGLADTGTGFNSSSPSGILQDHVEEFVQGVFEERLGTHGLDLDEVVLLAAIFENLVHQESMQRLNATLVVLGLNGSADLSVSQVDSVLDAYMMSYYIGVDYKKVGVKGLRLIQKRISQAFPGWNETQLFLREVRAKSRFRAAFFSRTELDILVKEVGDQFGRFQDRECQKLKQKMIALEDKTIGTNGSGRVLLSVFYNSALNDGNWQFSERQDYLEQLGSLDTQDEAMPRVIIPNYINSPSNCLARSKYYSVCCINECEDLFDNLEYHFAAPTATPSDLAEFVATLPSSTVPQGRTISPILLQRLEEIAIHHDGRVPLHGRLFAQWMHHAYPRECPFPHIAGSTRAQRVEEFRAEKKLAPVVTAEEMLAFVDKAVTVKSSESGSEECAAWSRHEELYVQAGARAPRRGEGLIASLRPAMYIAMAAAAAMLLGQRVVSSSTNAAVAVRGRGSAKPGVKDFTV